MNEGDIPKGLTDSEKNDYMTVFNHNAVGSRLVLGLFTVISNLREAIRKHRDQKGHDRCRLDDDELYAVLPEGKANADTTLPPRDKFLDGCGAYWDARNGGISHEHCSLVEVMKDRDTAVAVAHEFDRRNEAAKAKLTETAKVIDALDWCREHEASIHHEKVNREDPYEVVVEIKGYTYAAESLELAVALAEKANP